MVIFLPVEMLEDKQHANAKGHLEVEVVLEESLWDF